MFEIKGDKLVFHGMELEFNIPYEDISRILEKFIYSKSGLNQEGRGFILLRNTEFYKLKGTCSMYFRQGILNEIAFAPEWSQYDMKDKNGQRIYIDQAVLKIANECIETLKRSFGEPVEIYRDRQRIFYAGNNLIIATSVNKYNDNFSIILQYGR